MTAYLLADHLLNFAAPAACVALLLMLLTQILGRFSNRKRSASHGRCAQLAIIFVVSLLALAAGLAIFGVDGKMASYAAMVVAAGSCHWVLGK